MFWIAQLTVEFNDVGGYELVKFETLIENSLDFLRLQTFGNGGASCRDVAGVECIDVEGDVDRAFKLVNVLEGVFNR